MLATSLAQTGVDRGEVVERAFDAEETEDPGRVLRREKEEEEERTTPAVAETVMVRETGEEEGKHGLLDTELGNNEDQDVIWSLLESAGGVERGLTEEEAVGHGAVVQKEPTEAVRKKKRRKKGNVIDELFADLS